METGAGKLGRRLGLGPGPGGASPGWPWRAGGSAATKGSEPLHFDGRLELRTVVSELVADGGGEMRATDKPRQETKPAADRGRCRS